jgi:hypothetical protein
MEMPFKISHILRDGPPPKAWDGGNPQADAPHLTMWEKLVIFGIVAIMLVACIPVMVYDWCNGGGRRG